MRKPKLFILSGLPCSGKSTLATHIKDIHEFPTTIVSTDSFLEIIAEEHNENYEWAWKNHFKWANRMMMEKAQKAVKLKHNIIWDKTMLTQKARRVAMSTVTNDYDITCITIRIGDTLLFERLAKRNSLGGKQISLICLSNMLGFYQKPMMGEGFDRIIKWNGVEEIDV